MNEGIVELVAASIGSSGGGRSKRGSEYIYMYVYTPIYGTKLVPLAWLLYYPTQLFKIWSLSAPITLRSPYVRRSFAMVEKRVRHQYVHYK